MRHCRFVVSRFLTILFTLCLGLPGSGRIYASPVYADERSLGNGAQLYELHCSECHGREPAARSTEFYKTNTTDPLGDYAELTGTAPGEASSPQAEVPDRDEWPEWAERPDPGQVSERDARAEALNEVAAMIKKSQETAPERDAPHRSGGKTGLDRAAGFVPIPGATDLSDPRAYFYGTTEEEVFDNIANGTGAAMPGWRNTLENEEAIWDLVNYIRSFWNKEWLY